MRTSSRMLAAAVVFGSLAAVAWAPPALPCSPPLPSLDGNAVPDEGGTLPVNGVLHARLSSAFGNVSASVRADGSALARRLDVDMVGGVSRVNLEGLAASTSYTLTLTMDPDVVTEEGQGRARAVHFTTTRTVDTTAPTFRGTADVVVTHVPASDFVDSCGGGGEAKNAIDVFPPDVVDDVGLAGIKLVRVNDDGTRELRAFRLVDGDDSDDEGALTDSERTPGDFAYELVAVDRAGNESAPLAVHVTIAGAAGCTATDGALSSVYGTMALLLLAGARRARMRS